MPAAKETATIAVLNTKLDGAITQITELKGRFDVFQSNFIQKDLYNVKHEDLVRQVALNTSEIAHLVKNQNRNVSWVWPMVSFVGGGVMLFLINFALTHKGG